MPIAFTQDRWRWPGVLLLLWIAAGLRSVSLGRDANWDLKNYHWYNAWALLNGRLAYDVAPAQLQTYHNPLGDLPFWFLAHAIQNPRTVAFLMALPVAIAAFFLLRTLLMLFPFDRSRANGALWVGAAALIGISGTAGNAAWGSTFNEWPSSALDMAALWLLVRAAIDGEERRRFAVMGAGFLLGCSVGLKLTHGIYAFGLLAACMAFGSLHMRLRRPVVAGAFMALGFLATYGWWGWILWQEFANPMFPYFNSIFQSPWWDPVDFFDRNFGPRNWRQWIFFPIYFNRDYRLVGEVSIRDWRMAALFFLALAAWGVARYRNLRENPNAPPPMPDPVDAGWRVMAFFTLVSYLMWLKVFGIYRYLLTVELVSGALIVACVLYVVRHGRMQVALVAILAVVLVGTSRPGGWGRMPFKRPYVDVVAPGLPADSLVIMGYGSPMAYAAPYFDPGVRFVSPHNNFIGLGQKNRMSQRAEELIRAHAGPRYLLQYDHLAPGDRMTLQYFGLELDGSSCLRVRASFDSDAMRLCPLSSRARPAG